MDSRRRDSRGPRTAGKTTIAHGLLTLSLIPMFMRSIIGLKVLKNTLNYGANRIRYLSPVPAGSRSARFKHCLSPEMKTEATMCARDDVAEETNIRG
jgi:acyl dehydratase